MRGYNNLTGLINSDGPWNMYNREELFSLQQKKAKQNKTKQTIRDNRKYNQKHTNQDCISIFSNQFTHTLF